MSAEGSIERTATIINKLGLHARPAAMLVECCNSFRSEIIMQANGRDINGKNILEIMTLGAMPGTELRFTIMGDDAEQAGDAIVSLIDGGFGE